MASDYSKRITHTHVLFIPIMELGSDEDRAVCARCAELLPPTKVDVVITHESCPDGIMAAALMEGVEVIATSPGKGITQTIIDVCESRNVLMVDIAPANGSDYNVYESMCTAFVVLDHHPSNQALFASRPSFFYVSELSGASAVMAYTESSGEPLSTAVRYVQERDTWKWGADADESKSWSLAFQQRVRSLSTSDAIKLARTLILSEPDFAILQEEGKKLTETLNASVEVLRKAAREATIVGTRVMFVDMTDLSEHNLATNECGNTMAQEFACPIVYARKKEREYVFSVRGTGSLELARKLGGGGHDCAAGFSATTLALVTLL